jgi:hypothetical protein
MDNRGDRVVLEWQHHVFNSALAVPGVPEGLLDHLDPWAHLECPVQMAMTASRAVADRLVSQARWVLRVIRAKTASDGCLCRQVTLPSNEAPTSMENQRFFKIHVQQF